MSESDTNDADVPPDLAAALEANEDALVHVLEELDSTAQLLDLLAFASEALDDEMVVLLARTANQLGELADTATEPSAARGLESVLNAVGEAADEPPEGIGPVGLLRALRDPDVQVGLGYLLAVAGALGRELDRREPDDRRR